MVRNKSSLTKVALILLYPPIIWWTKWRKQRILCKIIIRSVHFPYSYTVFYSLKWLFCLNVFAFISSVITGLVECCTFIKYSKKNSVKAYEKHRNRIKLTMYKLKELRHVLYLEQSSTFILDFIELESHQKNNETEILWLSSIFWMSSGIILTRSYQWIVYL